MLNCFSIDTKDTAIPIQVVTPNSYSKWLTDQTSETKNWLKGISFRAEVGNCNVCLIPHKTGEINFVLCCVADQNNFWDVGSLPWLLPEGVYAFDQTDANYFSRALVWGLGAYQFTRYKKPKKTFAKLFLPTKIDKTNLYNLIESIHFVRDLINTPTDDMGPTQFTEAAKQLAENYAANFSQIMGEDLLKQNYPCIYTVGKASDDAPRLIDIRWGKESHPKVTLVGKGVCFDSGGLDIKSSPYMLLMKKDMAGGAHVLGLARMIMQEKIPVRLRVLIPVVENVISGNAYKPGDIIKSRKGLTIEIGNTDAEGRVILADALTEAVSEKPNLLIDITTLTGAARVALGTELPAVFSNNDKLVNAIIETGIKHNDLMWHMPLFAQYREFLNSQIADINNNSCEPYGGAIAAALFLKEFVPDEIPWLHFDLMAWNLRARPGRPQGAEATTLRALFHYISTRFAAKS